MDTPKTFKRELACIMLLYWAGMNTAGIWYPEALQAAEASKIVIWTFVGGAFALDAGAKQWGR
jgi:hypothetical protein